MVKKLFFVLLASLLVVSCGTLTRSRTTSVSFASFTDYPDMWISPNSCPMEHSVLGYLNIDVAPAILNPSRTGDGLYSKDRSTLQFERIAYDELLEMAVIEAKARKANGISNLSITEDRADGATYATGYHIKGLLSKFE